jgi:hypothetical protein
VRSWTYEASNGDLVKVTVYSEADRINGEDVDTTPEVILRPTGANRWGPPLHLLDTYANEGA